MIYGANWNETQSPTVWVPPPPRIMILWRSIESTTQIAQLRWRNVANVGMVAVGTTTLAQRRHGRRRHNYGGATSFSQRWANVFLPTICQQCRPCWKKKWKYLLFDFLKEHLFSRCQIQNFLILNIYYVEPTLYQLYNIIWQRWHNVGAMWNWQRWALRWPNGPNYVAPTSPTYVGPTVLLTLGQRSCAIWEVPTSTIHYS